MLAKQAEGQIHEQLLLAEQLPSTPGNKMLVLPTLPLADVPVKPGVTTE
jgi:hypothetical protein